MLNVGKGFLGLFIVTVVAGFSFSYAQESGEELPTGKAMRPKLEFPTVEAYSNEIGEAGIMLDREHVRLFAPKTRETEALWEFTLNTRSWSITSRKGVRMRAVARAFA